MIPIRDIATSNIKDRDEVLALSEEAIDYLRSMSWCREILDGWLAHDCSYCIGVFYVHTEPSREDVPRYHWVIVGDLPPAYLDVEYFTTWKKAIQGCIAEMQEWVDRVLQDRPIDDSVIPVNVPPEKVWAERLQGRLDLLRQHLMTGR